MKHIKTVLTAGAIGILLILGYASLKSQPEEVKAAMPTLTHAQLVYTYALEWCESQGNVKAINPKDNDNTPSYYSWQFKPGTFRYFGTKYGIIATSTTDADLMKLMSDYPTERKVLEAMVLDGKRIEWQNQFPGCTRKLGYPPRGV